MEGAMSNAVIDGLFLLAFWVPPLAVAAGALSLLVTARSPRGSSVPAHAVPATR
jgi:hypothetical protein